MFFQEFCQSCLLLVTFVWDYGILCLYRVETHIRHLHRCNRSCIHPTGLRFSKAKAFTVEVGVQEIYDIGGQAVAEKELRSL